jgi:hypothetical protein
MAAERLFSARVLLIDPVERMTGLLLIESDKPTMYGPPTDEQIESVWASLKRRECARANPIPSSGPYLSSAETLRLTREPRLR